MCHMDELTAQMHIQQQKITRLTKLDAMLSDAKNLKNILIRKADNLKKELEIENADLLKAEGKTFSALIHSVLGSLDKHVEKEKSEALAAKLKYDQALKDLHEVDVWISKLTAERATYTDNQREFDELFAIKRQALLDQNNQNADRILDFEKKIVAAEISLKEIGETKNAGRIAIEALRLALEKLDSAEIYSFMDMGGGGMFMSAMKYERIDEARNFIAEAQDQLERFKSELCDVNLNIDISKRLHLIDIFIDNTITDFMVQSRISKTQESVNDAIEKVKKALIKLDQMESEKKSQLESLSSGLKQLITYG